MNWNPPSVLFKKKSLLFAKSGNSHGNQLSKSLRLLIRYIAGNLTPLVVLYSENARNIDLENSSQNPSSTVM